MDWSLYTTVLQLGELDLLHSKCHVKQGIKNGLLCRYMERWSCELYPHSLPEQQAFGHIRSSQLESGKVTSQMAVRYLR